MRKKPRQDPNDAAALIQSALRRKFKLATVVEPADRSNSDAETSPDKKDSSWNEPPSRVSKTRSVWFPVYISSSVLS